MISLPLITVQHDAERVIGDVREGLIPNDKFWISCYKTGEPSIHASITVTKLLRSEAANPIPSSDNVHASGNSQPQVHLEPDDGGLELIRNSNSYSVTCKPLHIRKTPCRFPRVSIRIAKRDSDGDGNMNAERIPSFDVSPDGERLAIGHEDGSITVRRLGSGVTDAENSNGLTGTNLQLQPRKIHLDAITSLRFFPSSQVLLSSSADFSVSVISADDLSVVPRVFKGHRRTVTDTAIIDRGKQVVSAAKDGSVRLWDCGSGKQVGLMGVKGYSPVMKISLGEGESHVNSGDQGIPSESNGGKMLFCALHNGSVEAFDISSIKSVLTLPPPLPNVSLYSIAYSTQSHLLATGSTKGLLSIYDTRFISSQKQKPEPLFTCSRNEACIEDLAFIEPHGTGSDSNSKLAVATYDGTPFVLSIRPDGPAVAEELAGYDCDPCRTVRVRGDGEGRVVWVAGDDGVVRKY